MLILKSFESFVELMKIVEFVEVASDVDVEEAVDSSEGNCTDG